MTTTSPSVDSNSDLAEHAFEHIDYLCSRVGPRPAGSDSERQAQEYVSDRLREWGYDVTLQPVPFAPPPRIDPLVLLGGLWLAAGGLTLPAVHPWVALLSPFVLAALPDLARLFTGMRPLTAKSQNVIAHRKGQMGSPGALLLCAHIDTARASPITWKPLAWLLFRIVYISQRIAIISALLALLSFLGIVIPPWLELLVIIIALISGVAWAGLELIYQLQSWRSYTLGANDDASGVGVLLALAEKLSSHPLQDKALVFLFSGAEETGMHGARAFAARMLPEEPLSVINLDMVGIGGQLRYVVADGVLFQRRTSTRMNKVIRSISPDAQPITYSLKSGDYLPFLQRGFPSTSLQVSGHPQVNQSYHTHQDTLSGIEHPALDLTCRTLLKLIDKFTGS